MKNKARRTSKQELKGTDNISTKDKTRRRFAYNSNIKSVPANEQTQIAQIKNVRWKQKCEIFSGHFMFTITNAVKMEGGHKSDRKSTNVRKLGALALCLVFALRRRAKEGVQTLGCCATSKRISDRSRTVDSKGEAHKTLP